MTPDSPALRVVLAGGGTAGHVEPALNTADALRRLDERVSVTALGTARGLETTLVPDRGYDLRLIPAVPLPRKPSKDALTLVPRMRRAIREVREILDEVDADVVVGFGGYVALPAYLGARGRVPIVVHEANAKPGLANRVGARFTRYVAETVPDTLPDAEVVPMPLRPAILNLDRQAARDGARAAFGLPADGPVLLVFGGSQGARHINEAVLDCASELASAGVSVLHAIGPNNADQAEAAAPLPSTHVVLPYISDMAAAYAAADLAVCRAGAMTVAELDAVRLPAVYVPLPIGNGEQRLNAEPSAKAGAAVIVDDANFTRAAVLTVVLPLVSNQDHLRAMTASSRGRQDAGSDRFVEMILDAAASGTAEPQSRPGGS